MSKSVGIKSGEIVDAFEVIHFPKEDGYQWAKRPTHYPEQRPVTLYGIEVVDENGDATADAIMDRLVHASEQIELKGKSLRAGSLDKAEEPVAT
ncbi:hypothetical protein RKLH11_3949 [Rhodobacteraceae bacterium KLH11]|nr:hypothetical protein RKLH11_3949 [Rhodobacteraceae bacterium KLH11]